MKYFKSIDPYYALIQAKSFAPAVGIYTDIISADDEKETRENLKEISRADALLECMKSIEAGENLKEILSHVQSDKEQLLLIDGRLQ